MEAAVSLKVTVCGIEELPAHCKAGVSHVVSILDPNWYRPHLAITARMGISSSALTS
jgi:hypothetical protein